MMFLLSSAGSKLYRDDVLRALAAPSNSILQFRYDEKYVPAADLEHLGSLSGEKGFVCHATKASKGWEIFPVREVKIEQVLRIGRTVSVRFRVLGFVAERYFPLN